jgi:thymidylate kinase
MQTSGWNKGAPKRMGLNKPRANRLIIVEGLTGSGKSTMAHFIARQLQHNGIDADWFHEGEFHHPIFIDVESNIEEVMEAMLGKWRAFVEWIESSGKVIVVEACFFNNVIESLLVHNVDRPRIIEYGYELQEIVEPLNPALVYLVQPDIVNALARNFGDRGDGFKDYVIQYATSTPYATQRGLEGYEGMVTFWRDFVSVTDELFHNYHISKLMIDSSVGDWDGHDHRVLEFLSIPPVQEHTVSRGEALRFVGTYRDEKNSRQFTVQYLDSELAVNLFLNTKTRLIRKTERVFWAAGWYFEVSFEADDTGRISTLRIDGRDVDYLSLVGTVAARTPG